MQIGSTVDDAVNEREDRRLVGHGLSGLQLVDDHAEAVRLVGRILWRNIETMCQFVKLQPNFYESNKQTMHL